MSCGRCGTEFLIESGSFCPDCASPVQPCMDGTRPIASWATKARGRITALAFVCIVVLLIVIVRKMALTKSAPDAGRERPFRIETVSPSLEDTSIECVRRGKATVLSCKFVNRSNSKRFEGYGFSVDAFKHVGDGSNELVATPGVVANVPNIGYEGHAEFDLIIPVDAEVVFLHYWLATEEARMHLGR